MIADNNFRAFVISWHDTKEMQKRLILSSQSVLFDIEAAKGMQKEERERKAHKMYLFSLFAR
jgi:hypothetical protein